MSTYVTGLHLFVIRVFGRFTFAAMFVDSVKEAADVARQKVT